jgi:hypothetical protein
MEAVSTEDKCPRCAVTPHPFIGEDHGTNSRQTMDGASPTITICSTEHEVFRGAAGLPAIPFERWPVTLRGADRGGPTEIGLPALQAGHRDAESTQETRESEIAPVGLVFRPSRASR